MLKLRESGNFQSNLLIIDDYVMSAMMLNIMFLNENPVIKYFVIKELELIFDHHVIQSKTDGSVSSVGGA